MDPPGDDDEALPPLDPPDDDELFSAFADDALIALVLITVLRLPPLLHPPMSVLGEEALPWMDLPAFAGTDMECPILFPPLLPPGFVASVVVIEPGVVVAGIVGPVLD